jgi:hypothetical protein
VPVRTTPRFLTIVCPAISKVVEVGSRRVDARASICYSGLIFSQHSLQIEAVLK